MKKLTFPEHSPDLQNISVVLVRTLRSGNVGSAARAMKNMGISRLKLVSPGRIGSLECRKMAGKAIDLVERAETFDDLGDALAGAALVVATTSLRGRAVNRPIVTPREAAKRIRQAAAKGEVCLVFGSERSGLTDSQLAQAQMLVSIPTGDEHPVLNVAQSVLLLCYEVAQADRVTASGLEGELSSQKDREQLFQHMQEVLIEIGFLSSAHPEPIMNSLRSLFGERLLDSRDLRLVRGILSQMSWYVRDGFRLGPDAVRKP